MYVCSVVGPSDVGKTTLVERLVDRFAQDASVATVKHCDHGPTLDIEGKDTARHRAAGATTAVGIGDEQWVATGDDRTLRGTLDALAATHDYAFVEGFRDARLPTVVLGGDEQWAAVEPGATPDPDDDGGADAETTDTAYGGDPLCRAASADDVDLDDLDERLHATDQYESLGSLVAQVKRSPEADRSGAIATFTGRVRERDAPDDVPTEHLFFEKYEGVAEARLATLREDLLARDGVLDVRLHHRTGLLRAGEDIVFVVILAGHRSQAFSAVEDGINRLKEEVPFFKKEVTVDDAFWAHERDDAA